MDFNVVGNITKDPEQKDFGNGSMVYFTVAKTREYKNKETDKYDSDFYSIVSFFNQNNEYIMNNIKKGDLVQAKGVVENGKKTEATPYPKDMFKLEKITCHKKGKGHGDAQNNTEPVENLPPF